MPKQLLTLDEVQGRNGRPPAIVKEMLPKIEKLAGLGLSEAAIAAAIGVHPRTFSRVKNEGPEEVRKQVLSALKRGQLEAIEDSAREIKDHAKKNPIAAIYRAKAILGRHDSAWLDQKQVQHSGSMNVTIHDGVSGPQAAQDAIDADYEEVED